MLLGKIRTSSSPIEDCPTSVRAEESLGYTAGDIHMRGGADLAVGAHRVAEQVAEEVQVINAELFRQVERCFNLAGSTETFWE